MESYSKNIKKQLETIKINKKCCRFTEEKLLSLDKREDNSRVLLDEWRNCRCDGCRVVYIRRVFVIYGSVTDPEKSYHLDLTFKNEGEADAVEDALSECGFGFRRSRRHEKYVLYIKNSTDIEDFFVYIGASGAAFELMNSKIVHEFRNSVNRQVNCDTANIEKQIGSAIKYIEAIRFLEKNGKIDSLTPELKMTARLRAENDQASIADIGGMIEPPVSKSGMRHRLDKILEVAIKFGFNR